MYYIIHHTYLYMINVEKWWIYVLYNLFFDVQCNQTWDLLFIHDNEDNVVNYFRCFSLLLSERDCSDMWKGMFIYLKGIVHISERDCSDMGKGMFIYLKGIVQISESDCSDIWKGLFIYHKRDCSDIWKGMFIYLKGIVQISERDCSDIWKDCSDIWI